MKRPESISKLLSANDTGETGGHQAGILIPKQGGILSFFPELNSSEYNPRCHLFFVDAGRERWKFAFIYYNNALSGKGTRNEYRLTHLTAYMRKHGLHAGDELILRRSADDRYSISHKKKNQPARTSGGVLKLSAGWKVIEI